MLATKTLIAATCFAALLASQAAAQSNSATACGWAGGVYICNSVSDSPYARTTTLCATGLSGSGGCTTSTKLKPAPAPEPTRWWNDKSIPTTPNDKLIGMPSADMVRSVEAERRAADSWAQRAHYRDPAVALRCPSGTHMTAKDGCQ